MHNIIESKRFLGAVFELSEGYPRLLTETDEIQIENKLEENMLTDSPWTILVSYNDFGEGECWGIPFVVSDTRAAALVEAGYQPSFEIISNKNKPTIKVWLLSEPISINSPLLPSGVSLECPLPGVGGWTMEAPKTIKRHPVKLLEAFKTVGSRVAPAVKGTQTTSVLNSIPTKFNDALVYGTLEEDFLNRKVSFSFSGIGQETKPGSWRGFEDSLGKALNNLFTSHPVGKKNGLSFLQGNALEGVRVKTSMEKMDFLVLDLDTGESIENIKMRIAEQGLFAVIYTTHSHMKSQTEINRDELLRYFEIKQDPTISQIKTFLQNVRGYQNAVVDHIEIESLSKHTSKGVLVVVNHNPMQKFRVLFVLKDSFIFSQRPGKSHKEAMDEWGERYAGVSKKIGAFFDRSCVDPSRLFFTPRHEENTPFEINILAGSPLDLELIDPVPKSEWRPEASIWDKNATSVAKGYKTYETDNLMLFLKKYADRFEFEDFIRSVDPDGERGRRSSGPGYSWRCPNDAQHSNPGDEEDKGFFCFNASDSGNGFSAKCMHNSCFELDRADFLDLLCQQSGVKNALTLKSEFVSEIEEEEEDNEEEEDQEEKVVEEIKPFKSKDDFKKSISSFDETTSKSDVSSIAKRLAISQKINRLEKDFLIKELAKKTKTSVQAIKAEVKEATIAASKDKELLDDDIASELSKYNDQYGVVLVGGKARVLKFPNAVNSSPVLMDLDSFKIAHAPDKFMMMDATGAWKPQSKAKMWLEWEGRKYFPNGIVFEPGKEIQGSYNMWKGYPVNPRAGDWTLLKDHVYNNICRGDLEWYNWLCTWMAQMIQQPGFKMGSAVAIKGKKGVGKSKLFEWLMHLMGPYSIKVAHRHHITGNFNAHQKGVILMVCEEAFWAGDMEAGGVLKDMITSNTMMMEQKGFDPIQVSNHLRLAMISNEDWITPASFDDERRFFVLECSTSRQRDLEYFAAIDNQMNNGGSEAFMHFLKEWQPTTKLGWDILRAPPNTPWLAQQAEESLDALGKFLLMVAEEGEFPEIPNQIPAIVLEENTDTYVNSSDLRAVLNYHLRSNRTAMFKLQSRSGLRHSLETILSVKDGMEKVGPKGLQKWCYVFPPLAEIKAKLAKKGINTDLSKE